MNTKRGGIVLQVFDFDNTLYRGESAVDFALFLIRRRKRIILWLPKIFWNLLRYKLCMIREDSMEAQLDRFMQRCLPPEKELTHLVGQFWKKNLHRLNKQMLRRIRPGDAVISAGPDFLLRPIRAHLCGAALICSKVDLRQMRVAYLNFSSRKAQRYRAVFGNAPVSAFYTDSYFDRAMMQLSERVYLVKKGRARRIK